MNNIDSNSLVLLVEARVKPEHLDQAVRLAQAQLVPTLQEVGCIAFFQTAHEADATHWTFTEVFASEDAHEFHLAQSYTQSFFASMLDKLEGPPQVTRLRAIGGSR